MLLITCALWAPSSETGVDLKNRRNGGKQKISILQTDLK
jgi:hypothetical protein